MAGGGCKVLFNKPTCYVRRMFLIFSVLIFASFFSISSQAAKISLNIKSKTVYQSTCFKLKLRNSKGSITWKSSNPAVATVSSNGVVRTYKNGKTVISAKYKKKIYKCSVTVKRVKMKPSSLTMLVGRTYKLSLSRSGIPAKWESSDRKIASVDQNGKVRSLSTGSCTISASYRKVKWSCKLTVLSISKSNIEIVYPASKSNRNKIVLAGSSSVEQWNTSQDDFAPYEIINTAISGTTVTQWLGWYKSLITRYKPSAVVIYVGSNDLGIWKKDGKTNAQNTISLLKKIKKELKGIPLFYVSVVPCYVFKSAWSETAVSNQLVQNWCEKTSDVYYIALNTKFQLANGTPNRVLFRDQLHPNEAGYALWKKYVAKRVIKEVKKRAKK